MQMQPALAPFDVQSQLKKLDMQAVLIAVKRFDSMRILGTPQANRVGMANCQPERVTFNGNLKSIKIE